MPTHSRSCSTALEHPRHLLLAGAVDADQARHDRGKEPLAVERSLDLGPHAPQLPRHARKREHAGVSGGGGDAGGDPDRGQRPRADRQARLPSRHRQHLVGVETTALGDVASPLRHHRERVGMLPERHAQGIGETLGREVVVCRAEPPTHEQKVRPSGQGAAQRLDEPLAVVADEHQTHDADPASAERARKEAAVAVTRAAVQKLVAAEDDGGRGPVRRHHGTPPGTLITPRAWTK